MEDRLEWVATSRDLLVLEVLEDGKDHHTEEQTL